MAYYTAEKLFYFHKLIKLKQSDTGVTTEIAVITMYLKFDDINYLFKYFSGNLNA